MINAVFRLESPGSINVQFEEMSSKEHCVIVRPTYMSICAADARYFEGRRGEEVLKKKLPMALIHEACGVVARDNTGNFKPGQKVLLLPGECCGRHDEIDENYVKNAPFRSSNRDGFMQEYVQMDPRNLVPYEDIDDEVASLCEPLSVAMHAIEAFDRISHARRERIAVYGDGNLGYMVALLLKRMTGAKVHVVGVRAEKLAYFSFADSVSLVDDETNITFDHAFECVGGPDSATAIEDIISGIEPEGTLMLMGVSERPVRINTRLVLEKGLSLMGRSRSTKEDFIKVRDLLQEFPRLQLRLRRIIAAMPEVSTIADMNAAFNADSNRPFKTVIRWNV